MGGGGLLAARRGYAPDAAGVCGGAHGIPRDRRPAPLPRWVAEGVARGYRRVKIKVAPGWDEAAVRAARAGMAGKELPLTRGANGADAWPDDERAPPGLGDAGPLYLQQPLPPGAPVGPAPPPAALRPP